ncbi:bifunctional phosphopantothenoylcysteine decarboxylase/phosphopantothenate synthase [Candidatus Uhrbacteria bacterium]|nr:bifunctional phosphopantothenoylcysteine decarboxylase/phosphopantothenate synthase [Candidatus Uhrbacteria bacterium]
MLRILVTAGSTEVPIDRVRAITNIFKGRTGTEIALALADASRETEVTLLTSNKPLAITTIPLPSNFDARSWERYTNLHVEAYRTFDELAERLECEVTRGAYDIIIHSAAVSDYRVAAVHKRNARGELVPVTTAGKMSSQHEQLFLELAQTPKLVERMRRAWRFTGMLVQFKLEVGCTDDELLARARTALERSNGDLVVANCLEWARDAAYLVERNGTSTRIPRSELARTLVDRCGAYSRTKRSR